jgi:hypothetical protein
MRKLLVALLSSLLPHFCIMHSKLQSDVLVAKRNPQRRICNRIRLRGIVFGVDVRNLFCKDGLPFDNAGASRRVKDISPTPSKAGFGDNFIPLRGGLDGPQYARWTPGRIRVQAGADALAWP